MALALHDVPAAVPDPAVKERCPSCGGNFDANPDGATHAYMLSSPGCWSAYGLVLEREYSDAVLFGAAHRLTVDAYALQHPGDPAERRAVQSFWIHGASLWLVLRLGWTHMQATGALKALAGGNYAERPIDIPRFAFTHADVLARPLSEHIDAASHYANAALEGWAKAHDEFERLAQSVQ